MTRNSFTPKVNEEIFREVKEYADLGIPSKDLAEKLNLSESTVRYIVRASSLEDYFERGRQRSKKNSRRSHTTSTKTKVDETTFAQVKKLIEFGLTHNRAAEAVNLSVATIGRIIASKDFDEYKRIIAKTHLRPEKVEPIPNFSDLSRDIRNLTQAIVSLTEYYKVTTKLEEEGLQDRLFSKKRRLF